MTPSSLVDAVVTDLGMIPCTSGLELTHHSYCAAYTSCWHAVPVVLRIKDVEGGDMEDEGLPVSSSAEE